MHVSTPAIQDHTAPMIDVRSRVGTLVAGRYKLLRMIGEGGMGAVFEAEVQGSGLQGSAQRVAVKLIKPEYAMIPEVNARFLQEVRAAQSVGHPNIVQMLDAGSDAHGPYMVLELLRGETLCDVMERRPLGPREALGVMSATLDALSAAHAAGIVHRDIKPENIFLVGGADRCSAVKLLDFGISKIMSMQSAMGGLTRVGTAVGTPDYMSPEQAGGSRVDGRADLWSVGAVLYESVAQALPFEGETYQQLISHIILHAHTPLRARVPSAPAALEAFIDRALRKEPGDRYASAAEMFAAAQGVLASLPPDDAMGFRHDEPTTELRAAPNEPTQVIEVQSTVARTARPPRPPRHHEPVTAPLPAFQAPAHPESVPAPPWHPSPHDAPTPVASPLLAPPPPRASPVPHEDRGVSRNTLTFAAVVAGVLVLGALAMRLRAGAAPSAEATVSSAGPAALTPGAPPAQQPTAQVLNAPEPQAPAAQVLVPTEAPAPRPRAVAPAPRRVVIAPRVAAPAPAAGVSDGNDGMALLRAALPQLRACAATTPAYHGNVEGTVAFDPRGRARTVQLRAPSPVTVHGACMLRALRGVTLPAGHGLRGVPVFHTF